MTEKTLSIPVTLKPDDGMYLRMNWMSGKDEHGEYELTINLAGTGLHIKVDGKKYSANMQDWFGAVITAIREEGE